jgi:predicted GNAT superfamily acetyltransferase
MVTGSWQVAADAADVCIRELGEVTELRDACGLVNSIWSANGQEPLVGVSLLRALTHAGNYVAGAFTDGELVGTVVGFRGDRGTGPELHSHITVVASGYQSRRVGFAMKLHQRDWALRRQIPTVTWTFDPLVRRNAFFNLVKLGARPVRYLPDFYGAMTDAVNAGNDSDRLLIEWHLREPQVVRACSGAHPVWTAAGLIAHGARAALNEDRQGLPSPDTPSTRFVLVKVPSDVGTLRRERSEVAGAWRRSVREVIGTLLTEGASVIGFTRDGWYVLDRGGVAAGGDHPATGMS